MDERIDEDIVKAAKALRQKFIDLDSLKNKNVAVQARIKIK